jgi:lysozyme
MLVNVVRPVPEACIAFVKAHEGRRLTTYLDSAGIPTIGTGHTGPEVRLGLTITDPRADAYLNDDLHTAAERLEAKIGEPCVQELTDCQYAALLSFVFNLGTGDPNKPEWRIWQLLRAQRFDQIPAEMMRFVNAGGRKVQGLVNRRADEVKLWSTGEPGSVPDDPGSSYSRQVDTPPTSAVVKGLDRSKSFIGSCVAACATAAAAAAPKIKDAANAASNAIAPYVGKSEVLQGISSHLALVAAVAACAVPALLWLKNREAQTR